MYFNTFFYKTAKHIGNTIHREPTISNSDVTVSHEVGLDPQVHVLERPSMRVLVPHHLCGEPLKALLWAVVCYVPELVKYKLRELRKPWWAPYKLHQHREYLEERLALKLQLLFSECKENDNLLHHGDSTKHPGTISFMREDVPGQLTLM